MLRVLDVKTALEQLPVATDARGELALEVRDEFLPANQRTWRVEAHEGRLRVRADAAAGAGPGTGTSRSRRPRLTCTAESLALVVTGAVDPARAQHAGLLDSAHGAAELAGAWFRAPAVFLMPMNAF
jgi:hypothetical protein